MICNECETVAHCTNHGCIPKTTKKDEALKLALEWDKRRKYIMPYVVRDAIREALAEQPAQQEPVAWQHHAKKLTQWLHCMSYNDSYFGEPAGLVKQVTRELSKLIGEAPQPAQQEPVTEFKSPGQRWEDGDDHDSRSEALYKFIADTDFKHCGDSFCFKSGGDGDNGETLMFILDCWFAQQHTSPPAQRKPLTDEEKEAIWKKHSRTLGGWDHGGTEVIDDNAFDDVVSAIEAHHFIK